jgi:peptidoglycan/xylan/chitin deacetylase (PgdA/CDA1 family)
LRIGPETLPGCDHRPTVADVLVLCYHAVSERWPAPLSVTPEALEEQLEVLVRRGYTGATFESVVTARPAERTVVVTFDDAFASVGQLAVPILRRLGLPGCIYVVTDHPREPERPMSWDGIEQWLGTEHEHELRPLSWDRIGELAEAGWEVGSHTRSHPRLSGVRDEAGLAQELEGSRTTLEERLGRPCRTLAYPYGDHDERVMEAARGAGYTAAGTLPGRFPREPAPLAWPRVGIYHDDDLRRFRMKVARPMRTLRSTPLWPG